MKIPNPIGLLLISPILAGITAAAFFRWLVTQSIQIYIIFLVVVLPLMPILGIGYGVYMLFQGGGGVK